MAAGVTAAMPSDADHSGRRRAMGARRQTRPNAGVAHGYRKNRHGPLASGGPGSSRGRPKTVEAPSNRPACARPAPRGQPFARCRRRATQRRPGRRPDGCPALAPSPRKGSVRESSGCLPVVGARHQKVLATGSVPTPVRAYRRPPGGGGAGPDPAPGAPLGATPRPTHISCLPADRNAAGVGFMPPCRPARCGLAGVTLRPPTRRVKQKSAVPRVVPEPSRFSPAGRGFVHISMHRSCTGPAHRRRGRAPRPRWRWARLTRPSRQSQEQP